MTIIMQITAPHAQKRCCFIAVTPSECFGMSDYCSRNRGCLSLSKRTRSCGFRHFSVLAGSHAILPLERCVELAHMQIWRTLLSSGNAISVYLPFGTEYQMPWSLDLASTAFFVICAFKSGATCCVSSPPSVPAPWRQTLTAAHPYVSAGFSKAFGRLF